MSERRERSLHLSPGSLRAYSRAGNFHSDATEATRLGLAGLVAQGMQAFGPAYGLVLDEWGDELLAHGELELKFVGMVLEGQTVDAAVTVHDGSAAVEITVRDTGATAVVGTVRRRA